MPARKRKTKAPTPPPTTEPVDPDEVEAQAEEEIDALVDEVPQEELDTDTEEPETEDDEELTHEEQIAKAKADVAAMRADEDEEEDDDEEGSLTASDVAKLCGTDPKSFRKWLRGRKYGVGQGGRYLFTQAEAEKLCAEYGKRGSVKGTKDKAPTEKGPRSRRGKRSQPRVVEITEDDGEEEEDDEPADVDLTGIDDLEDLDD